MLRISKHPVVDPIKKRAEVTFTFDGKILKGFEGEMVSTALFANNIRTFSFHKKSDAPQGIFCANGQCSQCTVVIDGVPVKGCITPLKEGMKVETLKGLPKLPADNREPSKFELIEKECDVLVIGAGPAGLNAAIELGKMGFKIILVDDKQKLGGKLLLQTHKFFGSEEDCYAGTRGMDIAGILENKAEELKTITIYRSSSVVAVYKDQKAGLLVDNKNYHLASFKGIVVSAGARERSLAFDGNTLPGVYGAGAFQTIVNRDQVKAADKIFIIGSGNVGLIGAYHALQAGIKVAGIVEIADKISGYKVHADKIKRMGVPIYLSKTVISVEGDGKVEQITVADVDKNYNPILDTAKTYKVDTVLIAAGLTAADELYEMSSKYNFNVVKAGDADEIAEASSAMFGGKLAAMKMANILGRKTEIDNSCITKSEVLKSKPGKIHTRDKIVLTDKFQPIFTCNQEIPCNPCTTVCPNRAITLKKNLNTIMDIPIFSGECVGCGLCVAACPGLAITVARKISETEAEVILAHEFNIEFGKGDFIKVTDSDGNYLIDAEVTAIRFNKKYKTSLITVKLPLETAEKVSGIRVQDEKETKNAENAQFKALPDNGIVCRCEMVNVKEIVDFIKENNVRDIAQLKQIRVGMGACGSKTCSALMPMVFRKAGVDWKDVTKGRPRPLTVETSLDTFINEK